jgi:hypothetical protein
MEPQKSGSAIMVLVLVEVEDVEEVKEVVAELLKTMAEFTLPPSLEL